MGVISIAIGIINQLTTGGHHLVDIEWCGEGEIVSGTYSTVPLSHSMIVSDHIPSTIYDIHCSLYPRILYRIWLVVWTPLKNLSSSIWMITFPIFLGKFKIDGNQTTNQELYHYPSTIKFIKWTVHQPVDIWNSWQCQGQKWPSHLTCWVYPGKFLCIYVDISNDVCNFHAISYVLT